MTEQESRLQAYAAPGWNIDDNDNDSNETDIDTQDINLESYPHMLCYVYSTTDYKFNKKLFILW